MMNKVDGKKLLLECVDIFGRLSLPYFMSYGTALGAYRDGGFTPSEVDIDFGFLAEDFIKTTPFLANFLISSGFEITSINKPFTRCWAIKAKKYNINVDMVAVIPWSCQALGDNCRFEVGPNDVYGIYPGNLVDETDKITVFGDESLQLQIPHRIEDYLECVFGDDWKTVKNNDHSHSHLVEAFSQTRGIPENYLEQWLK